MPSHRTHGNRFVHHVRARSSTAVMGCHTLRLLLNAVLAYDHLLNLRIVALMRLYTGDDRVLAIAQMVEDILSDAPARTYEGFCKHGEDLKVLVAKIAGLAMIGIGGGYKSLALECADNGERLACGERRGDHARLA